MFCYQCSETMKGTGCTVRGVCGKEPEVANLQDLLIWLLKGVSFWGNGARKFGARNEEVDLFVAEGLFTTITNVNFDPLSLGKKIEHTLKIRDKAEAMFRKAFIDKNGRDYNGTVPEAASWKLIGGIDVYEMKGAEVGVMETKDPDIRSLRELLIYGLKGIAAYTDHAYILKHADDSVLAFLQEALAATLDDSLSVNDYVNLVMKAGEHAVKAMALLDGANTSTYGNPEVTSVFTGRIEGPGILVSGHDLLDLEEILKQTEGKGINIYTHGEMLPANAYPGLKKYRHLVGNYGTSWYNQQKEFEEFKGPIVMTTNCIQKPLDTYKDRIFTTGLVGWPNVFHIPNRTGKQPKDFTPVIEKALEIGNIGAKSGKNIVVGLAHNQLSKVSDKIIDAVKTGKIKKFVVMAGCDGHAKERQYYTDLASALPGNTVILTAGCAKYRYNMLELGDIGGIPRIVDAGQCNDSYSLAVTALKLKEAFGLKDINDLPIEYDIAWYEQKAVAVLLALLYLGVKGIRLGPVLPAFLSQNVLKVLVDNFNIRPITNVKEDLASIVGR
ncbi:MAG TPA: hydroxylamine reductase [Mesotoga infera]|uniref:Hydroxylamine reductase n=1 Tax=Mesotoga infera TaxID=1236046 RepID=A0A7Z7LCI8_9BACT|nr:hydroxylamine reductase [Mesotoga infera]MBP8660452.1 hydroxylamine reductase [Mesotoga sp.]NLI06331.1 hydroxylamine reductase [Thermotogaceae bacterium]SSC11554.1 Hydroxylamine reductase [Mesotoga infera]HOI34695.1 hydroxylamine reductase [Mesotoga infera]HON28067.1 hydroxylamine reductase [Mesotoga infera]